MHSMYSIWAKHYCAGGKIIKGKAANLLRKFPIDWLQAICAHSWTDACASFFLYPAGGSRLVVVQGGGIREV